jgi:hypothetical protein
MNNDINIDDVEIISFTVGCPHCGDEMNGPLAGMKTMWFDDLEFAAEHNEGCIDCLSCGKRAVVPQEMLAWFGLENS